MKVLTKNTDYAVRALLALGGCKEGYISARDISRQHDIPYQYLRKVLQKLISAGYVESKEGSGGGFKILAKPAKIKVSDIIEVFQGQIELSECMFRKKICANREKCVLRKNIKRIEKKVIEEFSKISIGSLLKDIKT